ncbi:MAG: hypothetical protein CO139_01650 [Candidatus Moranbacteria bacterium CG_4_9_14_3_um_filter_36_9]|nr:MAG: hypothetical protein CO139_01650 [Candidatus Moranbacteria bacterium CG_4_9_14_3_um_filter_36_9]
MEKNQKKRIIIIAVYVAIFLILVALIYSWLKPEPNCLDGIQNQNEADVDCGGICANKCALEVNNTLMVIDTGLVEAGVAGYYDIFAVIKNPNNNFGNKQFSYKFSLKDSQGNLVSEKNGKSFILPGEEKYIIENNIQPTASVAMVEFSSSNSVWVEIQNQYEKPQLKIISKNYLETPSGINFSEASGLLKNESPFDFSEIKVKIILKEASGKVVSLNASQMNTVRAGENRGFNVSWPNKFSGNVSDMEVQPEVNIFDTETFVKRYFRAQDFQGYD